MRTTIWPNNANAMLAALNNSPQCDADPACSDGRAKLQQLAGQSGAQDVLAKVESLSTLLQSAGGDLRSAGVGNPAAAQQKIAQMEQSADALAEGSKQLAAGVKTLVDQTKRMGAGMTQAADLLNSMEQGASQPSMAGMYIPPNVLTTTDFKNAAKLYISPDWHSARYLVETKFDPFSTEAMDQVAPILDTARAAQPNTKCRTRRSRWSAPPRCTPPSERLRPRSATDRHPDPHRGVPDPGRVAAGPRRTAVSHCLCGHLVPVGVGPRCHLLPVHPQPAHLLERACDCLSSFSSPSARITTCC